MAFYVFDLDGTLADLTHRRHHVEGEVKDWRAFFAACVDDAPIEHTLDLLYTLHSAGQRVEVWSGRSDEVRDQTRAWLRAHLVPDDVVLLMRTAGDHRPDDEVKREFLRGGGVPDMVFDDRRRVVEMWRREGVPCAQVADGDF